MRQSTRMRVTGHLIDDVCGSYRVQSIISNAVSKSVKGISSTPNSATLEYPAQGLPVDGSAMYFVLTAPNLYNSIPGFCTQ